MINKFASITIVLGIAVFFYSNIAVSKVEFPQPLFREQPESGFFCGKSMKQGRDNRGRFIKSNRTCETKNCNKKHYAQGLCKKHYLKQWHLNNRKKRAKSNKQYRQDHKKEVIKYNKQWVQNHAKKIVKYQKQYRQKHKEEMVAYKKQYNPEHREQIAKQTKQYRQTSKGKAIQHKNRHNRRAMTRDLTVKIVRQVYEDNIKKYGVLTCYLCFKPIDNDDSLDHSTPLSRKGTNNYDNLGIAHNSCNKRKFTKTLAEWFNLKK